MEHFQDSSSSKNPFSEARKMIADEIYVPSKWGRVAVDNSGLEPKIVYEENGYHFQNSTEEINQK